MKRARGIALLMGVGFGLLASARFVAAQACQDENAMVAESKKSVSDLVATVTHESLDDFNRAYHQKNAVSKLQFYGIAVDGLIDCLQKASQDPAAPKDVVEANRAKQATYVKLKEKIQHDHDTLHNLSEPDAAKKYIEKLDEAT